MATDCSAGDWMLHLWSSALVLTDMLSERRKVRLVPDVGNDELVSYGHSERQTVNEAK